MNTTLVFICEIQHKLLNMKLLRLFITSDREKPQLKL